uniref:Toxin-antitoxin system, antitoxin component, Xre family n=1 Tax=uncultured bacterium Contig643 TaxID=1393602 RepID=W0FH67_9BACT|nr:toxin-antitoxin system, antitoxin component, Xre family [uncultured bacterium Contig643]
MKLKEKREAAGMSQADLARETGISVRVIQNYEQGIRPLNGARAITVLKIARALGCTVEDLIEE